MQPTTSLNHEIEKLKKINSVAKLPRAPKPLRHLVLKIFANGRQHIRRYNAPPGKYFTDDSVYQLLMNTATDLEKIEGLVFRLVKLSEGQYNFIGEQGESHGDN